MVIGGCIVTKSDTTPQELIKECESYINKLQKQCIDMMHNREYSMRAKQPFKVMSFVNAMNWRMYETTRAAVNLINQSLIIPSLCLVRAAWEDMSVTYELKTLVAECCENQRITDEVDNTLMRMLFSNRFEKDNRYVGAHYYESLKNYKAKNILTLVSKVEKDFPKTKDFYSIICEFVHPNGDGVRGSYSAIDEKADTTLFGPQFTYDSEMFPAFVVTISCAIDLYLSFVEDIKTHLSGFNKLCEDFLYKKYNKSKD